MTEYLGPGAYIGKAERAPRPIEGVPTSTAAILGETERGSITPRLVTNYKDYLRWFGNVFGSHQYVPDAVSGFFKNGGKRVYLCRLVGQSATTATANFGDFSVRAAGPGEWGNHIFALITDSTTKNNEGISVGFRLRLAYFDGPFLGFNPFEDVVSLPRPTFTEDFDDLVTDEGSPDYFGKRLPFIDENVAEQKLSNSSSALAVLVRNAGASDSMQPVNGAQILTSGVDDAAPLSVSDFNGLIAGHRSTEQGLAALERDSYRDVSLVYSPNTSVEISKAIIDHCERMRFRFAIIDAKQGEAHPSSIMPRSAIADSSFAAFYYPWLVTNDPRTGARTLTPPGGHVMGVYARTDADRGVFKAPANEIVRGALSVEFDINDKVQDELNPNGVSTIRRFPGRGIRVWGARTLTSDAQWKYISVRRLFIFLEHSIYASTQWVVFEPNDSKLWIRIVDLVRMFLRAQWRLGALLGRTEQEAFFVRCDRSTMSQDDILHGRLICEIGIAIVRPAEFIIFRIFQNTSEAQH